MRVSVVVATMEMNGKLVWKISDLERARLKYLAGAGLDWSRLSTTTRHRLPLSLLTCSPPSPMLC